MSKTRTDLKSALRSLDVSKPLRIPPQLGFSAPQTVIAPQGAIPAAESPIRETGLKTDPVKKEPGQFLTESNFDPVKKEPGEKRTGSKFNPVETEATAQVGKPIRGFTRVPNVLLRSVQPFSEPVDFMIYLHLFTFSHGFERSTASMSLGQLERFTGAVRNTVRKSLERLTQQGWIECVEEFESARLSRKWKVKNPTDTHPQGDPPNTGSKNDPVKNSPGHAMTPTGSKNDPVTGSKFDPFLESSSKELSKNSLTRVSAREASEKRDGLDRGFVIDSQTLREYFGQPAMTPRKRQSEMQAYQELRVAFSEDQSAACLGQVLALVEAEERVLQEREEAFAKAYPSSEQQAEVIARYAGEFGAFVKQPGI